MKLLRGAVGVVVALLALASRADELTLRQATGEALHKNPGLRMAAARQNAAAGGLAEARSYWLPRIDVSETAMRSNNPVFVFGSLLEQGRFGPANFDPRFLNNPDPLRNYRLGLNVRFTVFDQLRRFDSMRQASNSVAQAKAGTDETQQATRLDVLAKFYGLLVEEARRDVAVEAVRSAEADASAMREKLRQGLLVESDALSAEVQLASFRQQQIEAEGGVRVARAALNTTIGRDALAETSARGELPKAIREEAPLEELFRRGLAARGELHAAKLGTDNARLRLQMARGSLLPRLDTFASWGASGPSIGDRNSDHAIGAIVSFDVFDGSKFARIAQARAGAEEANAAQSAARDKVSMEIIGAYERVRSARERIHVAEIAAEQAASAARIVRDRYEQGLTTITEQLRAQTALVTARLNLLSARYDYVIGSADLARSTGGLHDVDLFE